MSETAIVAKRRDPILALIRHASLRLAALAGAVALCLLITNGFAYLAQGHVADLVMTVLEATSSILTVIALGLLAVVLGCVIALAVHVTWTYGVMRLLRLNRTAHPTDNANQP